MSEKGSADVHAIDTETHPPTNSSSYGYGGNKEFNQWWDHWMSKVANCRSSAKSKLTKPDKARFESELDKAMQQKDAA